MRLETLSNHWLTNARSQKEHHLAMESDIVRRLLLERKRVPLGHAWQTSLHQSPRGHLRCTSHRVPNTTNYALH